MPQYASKDNSDTMGEIKADIVLPAWQTVMIDKRLAAIENNPERLRPIEELFEELDKD